MVNTIKYSYPVQREQPAHALQNLPHPQLSALYSRKWSKGKGGGDKGGGML